MGARFPVGLLWVCERRCKVSMQKRWTPWVCERRKQRVSHTGGRPDPIRAPGVVVESP
ncbi:hypothetical protein J6590_084099 [Homalodisca vitripennis]|nr:hypothetical protein J6590_084099 [Homalodisca vitripennis]